VDEPEGVWYDVAAISVVEDTITVTTPPPPAGFDSVTAIVWTTTWDVATTGFVVAAGGTVFWIVFWMVF
jgi:hypothetical protein